MPMTLIFVTPKAPYHESNLTYSVLYVFNLFVTVLKHDFIYYYNAVTMQLALLEG